MKVMTILGTRPEIIRLSETIKLLDRERDIEHVLVHTGQNYDHELNGIFFSDLDLRKPDHFLDAAGASFGETCGKIIASIEPVLLKEKPDAVLILGDTNSALSAIVAKRMHIPIYHMEAGNRCFDLNVPEEINRRIVDHISDFNLVYSEHARRHLLAEGLPHRRIYLTGSPMREVLSVQREGIVGSEVLDQMGLSDAGFLLVSVHREENVDNADRLAEIFGSVARLAEDLELPAIVTTHPRTRKRLGEFGIEIGSKRVRFEKPIGFHDYNRLQTSASCVLSDSGTIAEEAAILSFPAVTLRDSTERPEAIDTGSIGLTGIDRERIISMVKSTIASWKAGNRPEVPEDYRITDTSRRVVRLIQGTAHLSNSWSGIRPSNEK